MMTCFVSPKVSLDHGSTSDAVCRGTSTVFTCTTVTCLGHLEWRNSSCSEDKNCFMFNDSAMVRNTGKLGDFFLNLTHKETYQTEQCNLNGTECTSTDKQCNVTTYTSTATLKSTVEETTITCVDGEISCSRTVKIRSEFSTHC